MRRSGSDVTVLVGGEARGPALRLDEPLSFWGGVDPLTGRIIDRRHPQHDACVTGTVLIMPGGRGSSSSSTVLAESIRLGTAPAAIVLTEPDPIIALGAVVAFELYGMVTPVLLGEPSAEIRSGDAVHVAASGAIERDSA
jgi:predicted aconitase with swiveling domain